MDHGNIIGEHKLIEEHDYMTDIASLFYLATIVCHFLPGQSTARAGDRRMGYTTWGLEKPTAVR